MQINIPNCHAAGDGVTYSKEEELREQIELLRDLLTTQGMYPVTTTVIEEHISELETELEKLTGIKSARRKSYAEALAPPTPEEVVEITAVAKKCVDHYKAVHQQKSTSTSALFEIVEESTSTTDYRTSRIYQILDMDGLDFNYFDVDTVLTLLPTTELDDEALDRAIRTALQPQIKKKIKRDRIFDELRAKVFLETKRLDLLYRICKESGRYLSSEELRRICDLLPPTKNENEEKILRETIVRGRHMSTIESMLKEAYLPASELDDSALHRAIEAARVL